MSESKKYSGQSSSCILCMMTIKGEVGVLMGGNTITAGSGGLIYIDPMKWLVLMAVLLFASVDCPASETTRIASIEVVTNGMQTFVAPVEWELEGVTKFPLQQLTLVQVDGTGRHSIPFQVSKTRQNLITWLFKQQGKAETTRFELHKTGNAEKFQPLTMEKKNGRLVIGYDQQNLLSYQFKWFAPPEGVDSAYGRSGFIHPLWSPGGQVLTRIQPPDHYHHYGIWNPWTHLQYDGRDFDLWNISGKQGTVRFSQFTEKESGPVYAQYTALHEHVAQLSENDSVVILNELQTVRVYRPDAQEYYLMDMTISLSTATDKPVNLREHRYGGFGWRATEKWNADNSEVLSSEGHDRSDVDSTLGQWFYVQGEIDDAYAGAMVMSHPDNFNHPEPIRIWPVNDDNGGEIFASFSPTKNRDWFIESGKNYTRTYRFLVYNGRLKKSEAIMAWKQFSSPVSIEPK